MRTLSDEKIYLDRLARPLAQKLQIARYLPIDAQTILDVGCCDGTVTLALADLFSGKNIFGIDLNEHFINLAKEKSKTYPNVHFERIYLRELLARPEKFDVVIFCSVLHEFFTYGEGISSVLKAIADAHEILKPGGVLIIRDMILPDYTKRTDFLGETVMEKIYSHEGLADLIKDTEKYFGKLNSVYRLNHFLLKYMYRENWAREGKENYVPVTFEEYEQIFKLLGMTLLYKDSYLIEFLKNKWQTDFGLTDKELANFKSTGILVVQK